MNKLGHYHPKDTIVQIEFRTSNKDEQTLERLDDIFIRRHFTIELLMHDGMKRGIGT